MCVAVCHVGRGSKSTQDEGHNTNSDDEVITDPDDESNESSPNGSVESDEETPTTPLETATNVIGQNDGITGVPEEQQLLDQQLPDIVGVGDTQSSTNSDVQKMMDERYGVRTHGIGLHLRQGKTTITNWTTSTCL